jgi:translin
MMSASPPSAESPRGPAPLLPETTLAEIEIHLRTRERRREELADRARKLRRASQVAMTEMHSTGRAPPALEEVRRECAALGQALQDDPGEHAVALDGLQEAVEAILLAAVLGGHALPGPRKLGVGAEPYLLGLGDLAGEVRRLALGALAGGSVDQAEGYLRTLDELLAALLRFDAPRSIVALKPKQDAARGIVERTRGDVTLARMLARARVGEAVAK